MISIISIVSGCYVMPIVRRVCIFHFIRILSNRRNTNLKRSLRICKRKKKKIVAYPMASALSYPSLVRHTRKAQPFSSTCEFSQGDYLSSKYTVSISSFFTFRISSTSENNCFQYMLVATVLLHSYCAIIAILLANNEFWTNEPNSSAKTGSGAQLEQ